MITPSNSEMETDEGRRPKGSREALAKTGTAGRKTGSLPLHGPHAGRKGKQSWGTDNPGSPQRLSGLWAELR